MQALRSALTVFTDLNNITIEVVQTMGQSISPLLIQTYLVNNDINSKYKNHTFHVSA